MIFGRDVAIKTNQGGKLKSTQVHFNTNATIGGYPSTSWETPNEGATNESGFSALPSGYVPYGTGNYGSNIGGSAFYWTSTEGYYSGAGGGSTFYVRYLSYDRASICRQPEWHVYSFNVRCIQD